jgi:hypothetical protein
LHRFSVKLFTNNSNQLMRLIYTAFGLALMAVLFLNNSTGAGLNQNTDRTGSPLSPGYCNACHSNNAFSPSLAVRLIDGNGQTVTSYTPGASYQLEVVVNTQTAAQRYGFQAVALSGTANANAGAFATATGIRVVNIAQRQYAEQQNKSASNTFRAPWTAPASGSGPVRFYAAGVAANNNGTSNGDGAANLGSPLVIPELTSSISDVEALPIALAAFPNPAQDQVTVRIDGAAGFVADVLLFDASGRLVQRENRPILPGRTEWNIDLANLSSGQYWIEVRDELQAGARVAVRKQ